MCVCFKSVWSCGIIAIHFQSFFFSFVCSYFLGESDYREEQKVNILYLWIIKFEKKENACVRCHGHARFRRVVYGRMLMTSATLYVFSRKYDVSEISYLGLSDMRCLRMYYREIRLVINFSPPNVIYCEPLLFLSCLLI